MNNQTRYNVECLDCGQVFVPTLQSPLWWQAHQAAKKGRLDCIKVSGQKCGCVKKQSQPTAPFRVFGYDDMCRNFDIPCNTFVEAVTAFRDLNRRLCTVFVSGISETTRSRIGF